MELPRGKHVTSEKSENFDKICDNLSEDFRGAISIVMKVDNHLYKAGILIRTGDILAVSLEDLDKNKEDYGEDILDKIKDMTKKARGDVDVYSFEETAMELAIRSNMHLMFRSPLDLIRLVKTKEEFEEIKEDRELAELEIEEEPDKGNVEEVRKAERDKAEKDKEKPEREKAEKDKEKPEREKAEKDKKDKAEREKAEKDKEKAEKDKKEKAEREKAEKDKAEKARKAEEARKAEVKKAKEEEDLKDKELEELSWEEELNKLDEEWKSLEDEWETIRLFDSNTPEKSNGKKKVSEEKSKTPTKTAPEEKKKPLKKPEDKPKEKESTEDGDMLDKKPKLKKGIKFTDKIKLLKYSGSSEIIGLLDGEKTIREICIELDKEPDEVIPLVDELKNIGYIQEE